MVKHSDVEIILLTHITKRVIIQNMTLNGNMYGIVMDNNSSKSKLLLTNKLKILAILKLQWQTNMEYL